MSAQAKETKVTRGGFPRVGKAIPPVFQSLENAKPHTYPPFKPAQSFSERHLRCVWFNPELRPPGLSTAQGEAIEVESPGVWNLEAGPDFLGAVLRLGPERRRVSGDVEIHIHSTDWQAHGHSADPRYEGVRFHVTFFPGTTTLPPNISQIALQDALATQPRFAFESIELTAYPYAMRAPQPPCGSVLKSWAPDDREAFLATAGAERLRHRADRIVQAIAERGPDQVIYEEVMAALGYKQNQVAFRRLAEAVPLAILCAEASGQVDIVYALLAGVAGLLPGQLTTRLDEESRAFVRRLWDTWWKRRERFANTKFPPASWRLSGLRPLNHPLRRLAAAATLFTAPHSLAEAWGELAKNFPNDCLARARDHLLAASHPFWDYRLTLTGKRTAKPAALIGVARADAILINDFVPFLATQNGGAGLTPELLVQLPVEQDNAVLRETAFALFGRDAPNSLLRDGLRRQGLLHIFHTYCLNDRSRCAICPLPALLQQ